MSRTVKRMPNTSFLVRVKVEYQNWEDKIAWGETLYGPYSSHVAAKREADMHRPKAEDAQLNAYYRSLGEFVGRKHVDILESPLVFSEIEHTVYLP